MRECDLSQGIRKASQKRFGGDAVVFRAPGRVNLIGEHTDYNGGFVMPAAIDFSTYVAIGPRSDRKLVIYSEQFGAASVELDGQRGPATPAWVNYVYGVAATLEKQGLRIDGANVLVDGGVPVGAGLSSSAALEVSSCLAFLHIAGEQLDGVAIARACQQAEHDYAGAHVGIMDQFVSANAKAGHALLLDCRSLQCQHEPLPAGIKLVVCNTMVKHAIAGGEYNARRRECEEGVRELQKRLPCVSALRDVAPEQLEQFESELPTLIYRRCRHVVSEDARVESAAKALQAGDLQQFGRLMQASHESLRQDYEVSCRELDVMVEIANQSLGVYGARMTGGGFGGCTVNLVAEDAVAEFEERVGREYRERTGIAPEIYVCAASAGAQRVDGD